MSGSARFSVNKTVTTLVLTATTVAAGLLVGVAPASAQNGNYTLGGDARAFAMGGAGIALLPSRGSSSRANPASLGFERNDFVPTFPSVGVRSAGPAPADAASSYLFGGTKNTEALTLAANYGTSASDIGLNAYAALRMGKLEVSSNAVGIAHVKPNADWASWASTGSKLYSDLTPNARADVYAAGYYTLPAVAFGNVIPSTRSSANSVALGFRVKEMVGIYSHRIVDQATLAASDGQDTRLAPEMNGQSQLKKTGLGADVGFMVRPSRGYGFSFAAVVENAVKPSFVFESKDDAGKTIAKYNILQTSVSAGIGYQTKSGLTFAADLADIGSKRYVNSDVAQSFGSAGQEFRVGVEQRLFNTFSLRGGYSNLTGPTYGLGFAGVDIAIGKRVPLEVVKSLRF